MNRRNTRARVNQRRTGWLGGVLLAAACASHQGTRVEESGTADGSTQGDGPIFFATPRQAIERIDAMLRDHDWATLARCYDLSGSELTRQDLVSGHYFASGEPFSSRSEFFRAEPELGAATTDPQVWVVQVGFTDWGDVRGGRPENYWAHCRMIRTHSGYQMLPSPNPRTGPADSGR